MQEENNPNNAPELIRFGATDNGASLPKTSSDEDKGFVEEELITDHTDYETDWLKFDISGSGKNEEDISDSDGDKISHYEQEIRKLKKKQEQHNNHYARMRNKMKGELRKDRNARLVMWGAEFEYEIGKRNPNLKKLLPYLDRNMQKKIIWHIFAEIRTGPLIIKILKDYTKDIKDILPDDLKPYAE